MLNDNLNENNENSVDNQNKELHDITKEIAATLRTDNNGTLVIPENFDGIIYDGSFWAQLGLVNVVADSISKIYSNAFELCINLKNVSFRNVTEIRSGAFQVCDNIKSLDLPKLITLSSSAFSSMKSLETVCMFNLEDIVDKSPMFTGCPKLKEIRIKDEKIGQQILDLLDPDLKEAKVYIGHSDKPLENNIVPDFTDLKDISKKIAASLIASPQYYDSNGVLVIPENFNGEVNAGAFSKSTYIGSIDLNAIEKIGESSFSNCIGLKSISGENVTEINLMAFHSCTELGKVNFPNVEKLDSAAFLGCTSLETFDFPKIETIPQQCFGCCDKLTEITLQNIVSIETGAFSKCENLYQVYLMSTKNIEQMAFSNCHQLKIVSMPNIESLDPTAFNFCNLSTIITSTFEKCNLIFESLDNNNRLRIKRGECYMFYGSCPENYRSYLDTLKEQENQEKERLIQEKQQIIDNFIEPFKTSEADIVAEDICPICNSKFNELDKLENNNFVCTIHEDPKTKAKHLVHKRCFLSLIQFRDHKCPICDAPLDIPDDIGQAFDELIKLKQQDDD